MNSSSATQSKIVARIESLLGASSVLFDEAAEGYAINGITPSAVALPHDADKIAALVRTAGEENWVVVPYGSGSQQHIGNQPQRIDIALSTERLSAIEAYDPGDLTISLQAGAKVSGAITSCAEHRQLLPIDAPSGSTIGGALATGIGGPLRTGFGGLRDFCIGLSFITGDGASGRGGGRVVKNVAGYDLMKLMIGSYGSLGVITSANFKLFPLPQQTMTCVCEFESLSELFLFRDLLLKSPLSPLSAEIISPSALEYLSDAEPRDPDLWAPASPIRDTTKKWQLAIRFAGSDRVLARCRQEVGSSLSRELLTTEEAAFWVKVRDFEARVIKRHRNAMTFHVDVPIAESQSALEAAEVAAVDYNFLAATIGRASLGSFVIAFLTLAIDPPAVTQFASAASDFRSRLSRSASAIAAQCPREAKQHFDVWGSTSTDVELMRKIKRALDPKGILNRGRFLAG